MNIEQIKQVLPHRDPFLFLDRVIEISSEEIIAEKTFPKDESFYEGHFPSFPITPGVIILEAMAQACGVLGAHIMKRNASKDSVYLLAGIDNVRFKQKVLPNDIIKIKSKVITSKRGVWKFFAEASVDNKLVCSANILCADKSLDG
tara:strand:- start:78 stop:515 length:438 start_codon:yes stop_codon:yes gene_type:complete